MSQSTPGTGPGGDARSRGPFDPISGLGSASPGATGGSGGGGSDRTPPTRRRGRPPVWLLVLAGVLVVGLVVTAALVLGKKPAEQLPTPEAEVVTLAPPTPAIEPIAREAGTAFYGALPSTVLGYALTEAGAFPDLVAGGALEGYRLVYSDGGPTTITLVAGQWATPEAATAAYQSMVAAQSAFVPLAGAADATASPSPTDPEEGPVQVAGADVGRYSLVPRADGTGALIWSNGTVVLQADGPAAVLRDFFTAYSL